MEGPFSSVISLTENSQRKARLTNPRLSVITESETAPWLGSNSVKVAPGAYM